MREARYAALRENTVLRVRTNTQKWQSENNVRCVALAA